MSGFDWSELVNEAGAGKLPDMTKAEAETDEALVARLTNVGAAFDTLSVVEQVLWISGGASCYADFFMERGRPDLAAALRQAEWVLDAYAEALKRAGK